MTNEGLLRIFPFCSWYCDWNADLFVEEALTEESMPHCVEAKAQGEESQSVG